MFLLYFNTIWIYAQVANSQKPFLYVLTASSIACQLSRTSECRSQRPEISQLAGSSAAKGNKYLKIWIHWWHSFKCDADNKLVGTQHMTKCC